MANNAPARASVPWPTDDKQAVLYLASCLHSRPVATSTLLPRTSCSPTNANFDFLPRRARLHSQDVEHRTYQDRIAQLEDDVAYLSAELASLRASASAPFTKLAPEAPQAIEATTRTTCSKCDRSFTSRNKIMKYVYGNNYGGKGKGRDGFEGKESTGGKSKN